jgi:hypothetical protein
MGSKEKNEKQKERNEHVADDKNTIVTVDGPGTRCGLVQGGLRAVRPRAAR